jgi:hypothetical protein
VKTLDYQPGMEPVVRNFFKPCNKNCNLKSKKIGSSERTCAKHGNQARMSNPFKTSTMKHYHTEVQPAAHTVTRVGRYCVARLYGTAHSLTSLFEKEFPAKSQRGCSAYRCCVVGDTVQESTTDLTHPDCRLDAFVLSRPPRRRTHLPGRDEPDARICTCTKMCLL